MKNWFGCQDLYNETQKRPYHLWENTNKFAVIVTVLFLTWNMKQGRQQDILWCRNSMGLVWWLRIRLLLFLWLRGILGSRYLFYKMFLMVVLSIYNTCYYFWFIFLSSREGRWTLTLTPCHRLFVLCPV